MNFNISLLCIHQCGLLIFEIKPRRGYRSTRSLKRFSGVIFGIENRDEINAVFCTVQAELPEATCVKVRARVDWARRQIAKQKQENSKTGSHDGMYKANIKTSV